MRILQILFITITAFAGCAKKAETNTPNFKPVVTTDTTTKTMSTDTLHYLALGDSYTIGESVPQNESYPYQLTALLNKDGFNIQPPSIIAVTGWTTDDLIRAIGASTITNKKFDIVTLLIGVNDQYQQLSQDNYRTKFAEVLQTAIKFAGGDKTRVFVISIPDWGVTPFANGQESTIGPIIDQFNNINRDISNKAGVNYTDITAISRQAATNLSLVAPDGLHPSGKMYTEWMNLLEPDVKARLKK